MLRVLSATLCIGLASQAAATGCDESFTQIKPDGRVIIRAAIEGCASTTKQGIRIETSVITRQPIADPEVTKVIILEGEIEKTPLPEDVVINTLVPEPPKVTVVIPQKIVVAEPIPVPVPVIVPEPPLEVGDTLVFHNINFEVDKAILKTASYRIIKTLANDLKKQPAVSVLIEGHTDSDGSNQHNLDLSQRRAMAVKTQLIKYGVDASRLSTRGMGEDHPMATNATTQGKALNRRVVFKLG